MKTKKTSIAAIMSALGTGASYELAIQGASKRVDFINENYLVVKSLTAGLFGSGLVYFSKPGDEAKRAAGYGLLAIAGASGASKLSTVLVTSGGGQVNGLPKLNKIKSLVASRRNLPAVDRMKRSGMFAKVREGQGGGRQGATRMDNVRVPMVHQSNGRTRPGAMQSGVDYDQIAYSDIIYNV